MNESQFVRECNELAIELSPDQIAQFTEFEEALYRANQSMNLTRIPREECWIRHFLDSLLLSPSLDRGVSLLDIGTGPGFPAWPIACARPDLQVVALDSSGKMLSFLKRFPLSNLAVVHERAETWATGLRFDVVTGRALAPLSIQLEVSARLTKLNGIIIPLRTPNDRPEIERLARNQLGVELEAVESRFLRPLHIERVFPTFRKVKETPSKFPRSWTEMKKKPL